MVQLKPLLAGFVRSSEDSGHQEACCKGLYALPSAAQSGESDQLTTWQVVRASVTMLELGNEIRNFATIMLVNISCSEEEGAFHRHGIRHIE